MSPRPETRRRGGPPAAIPGFFLALLLAVPALAPLAYPGFFQARSGFLPAFRAAGLEAAFDWGQPAGTPSPGGLQGEGKLPYLLIAPVLALSDSGVVAVRWGYGLAILLGTAGTYAWARRRLGSGGGVLAAVVYTYLPWHLSAVYVRGAYAEAWLWALWPFLLWAADGVSGSGRAGTLAALAVGGALLAAAFWTQAGLTTLFVPLLVAYALLGRWPHRPGAPTSNHLARNWLGGVLLVLLAILLFAALRGALGGTSPLPERFTSEFLYPFQFFADAAGEGLSFQLGTIAVGLGSVALALGASRPGKEHTAPFGLGRFLWFFAGAALIVVALSLHPTAPLWEAAGLDALLAHPWQVLALAGLPLAFLAGATVRLDPRLATLPALAGLLALVILAGYPRLAPDFTRVDPGPEPLAGFRLLDADRPAAEEGAPQILLLDYAASSPAAITPTLALTLTWQALAPVDGDYTVFVHLLDHDGEKVAQGDSRPCNGACPTDGWRPGQVLIDPHTLDLPPGARTGSHRLAVGLYLVDSGERAAVVGRDDRTVYLDVP